MVNGELLTIWWKDVPEIIKFTLFYLQGLEIIEFVAYTQMLLKR